MSEKKNTEQEKKQAREKNVNFFGIPAEISFYYGFEPINPPTITKEDISYAKSLGENLYSKKHLSENPLRINTEEKISILRKCIELDTENRSPQSMLIFHQENVFIDRNNTEQNKLKNKNVSFGLNIIGTEKSIADAIIIETTIAILKDEGFKNINIEINSVGDKESFSRFNKELSSYYRKFISEICAECRQTMKENLPAVLSCNHEQCIPIHENAPKSLSFLTESSRAHFKEILEYMESLGLPYVVNNRLIGNPHISNETVFAIYGSQDNSSERTLLAIGSRYNNLGKKIGSKKEICSVGINVSYLPIKPPKKTPVKIKRPCIYFIQLGFTAKLKSLKVIELMREIKIPVYQSLSKDKISVQINHAEKTKVPISIIMGQMEAVSDSVIVRNNTTRSQETIKIKDLPTYLKGLKC